MAGTPQQPIKADLSCQGKTDAASAGRLAGGPFSQEPATVFKGTADLSTLRSLGEWGSADLGPSLTARRGRQDRRDDTSEHASFYCALGGAERVQLSPPAKQLSGTP